jgi:hypothetical protein
LPLYTCCGRGKRRFLEHPATLAVSVFTLFVGLLLYGLMMTGCARYTGRWSPFPWAYGNTPCFSEGGNNAYFNHGFWSSVFLGVGAPFTACALWAHIQKKANRARDEEEDARLVAMGLAHPTYPRQQWSPAPQYVPMYPGQNVQQQLVHDGFPMATAVQTRAPPAQPAMASPETLVSTTRPELSPGGPEKA